MSSIMSEYSFLCLLLVLLFNNKCCESASASQDVLQASPGLTSRNYHFLLGDPAGCPTEHFAGIETVISGTSNYSYQIGDEVSFRCSVDKDPNSHDQYIVFPRDKRTCQSNGVWSGVPPACVKTTKNFQSNADSLSVIANHVKPCTADACMYERENWKTVGHLDTNCSPSITEHSNENQDNRTEVTEMIFTFPRHLHFNFMTFSLPDKNDGESRAYQVEVKAPWYGVIRNLPKQSSSFLEDHYQARQKSSNECAVIRLDAYTRQLLVRFSVAAPDSDKDWEIFDWSPLPKFYPVPQVDQSIGHSWHGPGCTEPPIIPDSVRKQVGHSEYHFDCRTGTMLVDPITNEKSYKRIHCHRGYEWSAYPLPVCRPKMPVSSDVGSRGEQAEEPVKSAIDNSYQLENEEKALPKPPRNTLDKKKKMPTLNYGSFINPPDSMKVPVAEHATPVEHRSKNVLHEAGSMSSDLDENWQYKELSSESGVGLATVLSLGLVVLVGIACVLGVFLFAVIRSKNSRFKLMSDELDGAC